MNAFASFDKFPWWMVITCNSVGLGIYGIGLYLMAALGIIWAALYAAYCVWMESRLLSGSCRYCYYFGKRCAFGRGLVCSWLFKERVQRTCCKQISWRDLVPDFMVSLIPLGVGILLLVRDFSWVLVLLVMALVALASFGTGLVRSQLACRFCRQRDLGCPAERLFNKML